MEILIPVTTLACGLPMFSFWGDFSLTAVDVIPSFVTIIDEMRYPAHRVELIFHFSFSLSLFPPRFVLSRGRWGSGEVAEERPAAHQWPRELHRFPYATPRRTRYMMPFFFFFYFFFHSTYIRNQLDGFKRNKMMCAAAYKTLHVYNTHNTMHLGYF